MTTAYAMVLAVKMLAAGERTMRAPQNVAFRDIITMIFCVGFRAVLALTPVDGGNSEHKNLRSVHNENFSLQMPSEEYGRDHTEQLTERAVHDYRAFKKARGTSDKEALWHSFIECGAIMRHHARPAAAGADDKGEAPPTALFVCSCVGHFDLRARQEFEATVKGMSAAASRFVFADAGRGGMLWVSTPELASKAGSDHSFQGGDGAKRVCMCKFAQLPEHDCDWDSMQQEFVLESYTRAPLSMPIQDTDKTLAALRTMKLLPATDSDAQELEVFEWFGEEMVAWWRSASANHEGICMPTVVREMRTAYTQRSHCLDVALTEPSAFVPCSASATYLCRTCKQPKVKHAVCPTCKNKRSAAEGTQAPPSQAPAAQANMALLQLLAGAVALAQAAQPAPTPVVAAIAPPPQATTQLGAAAGASDATRAAPKTVLRTARADKIALETNNMYARQFNPRGERQTRSAIAKQPSLRRTPAPTRGSS